MSRKPPTEVVSFLTVESGDDLILAFAIDAGDAGEVQSLILMRTPKYEGFLDPEERGVKVSHEALPERNDELLRRIRFGTPITEITSTRGRYLLELSQVDADELAEARRVLDQMNFDHSFVLETASESRS